MGKTQPKKKRHPVRIFFDKIYKARLKRLKVRLKRKKEELDLKIDLQKNSHSLFWVWEFSKKAVLICFMFYIIVQVYAMVVMIKYYDFTHLGDLIIQTGELVRDCVFGYLIKAGVENIGKIFCSSKTSSNDDFPEENNTDEPVG